MSGFVPSIDPVHRWLVASSPRPLASLGVGSGFSIQCGFSFPPYSIHSDTCPSFFLLGSLLNPRNRTEPFRVVPGSNAIVPSIGVCLGGDPPRDTMPTRVLRPMWGAWVALLAATCLHVAADTVSESFDGFHGTGSHVEAQSSWPTAGWHHSEQRRNQGDARVPNLEQGAPRKRARFRQSSEKNGPIFVAELCRHGDRTPISVFPTDPWPIPTWKWGPGQLTPIGEAAQYNLGEILRNRYQPPWPMNYTLHAVRARSTDVDRCLMSAESQLAGIFPPGSGTPHALPYEWQAVPVHTAPIGYDALLRAFDHAHCPRYDQIMARRKEGKAFQTMEKEHKDFLEHVGKLAGMKISLSNLYIVSDAMVCERAHGRAWATGLTEEVFAKAVNLSDWTLAQMFAPGPEERTPHELARLTAGNLVQRIKELMLMAANGNDTVPMFQLFSAHDTTVTALLSALNAFDGVSPPYNSTVMFELWEKNLGDDGANDDFHVVAYYNWKRIVLPGCQEESHCRLGDFVQGIEPIAVESEVAWAAECQVLDTSHSDGVSLITTMFVGLITFAVGVLSTYLFPKLLAAWRSRAQYIKMEDVPEINLQATVHEGTGGV